MENYSQLTIDLVDETEQLITYDATVEEYLALHYNIQNILEVIDKSLVFDLEALRALKKIIEEEIKIAAEE
jgi:hypothetical protein